MPTRAGARGRWRRWTGLASLVALLTACAPKTPAQLVEDGQLFEACQLGDEEYPERSRVTREAMRQAIDIRIELELLDERQVEQLVGAPLPRRLKVLRQRYERAPSRVATSLVVDELRLSRVRYEPVQVSEGLAVQWLDGDKPSSAPPGAFGELFLLAFLYTMTPLCVAQGKGHCDPSKVDLPALEEMARRDRERLEQLDADPELRRIKERLLELFGEKPRAWTGMKSVESYSLLVPRHDRVKQGPARITFAARHNIWKDTAECSLLDRFWIETMDINQTFASSPRLSDLDLGEITIWPDGHAGHLPSP